jgi:hypothetical protein
MITILHILAIAFFAYISLICAVEHGKQDATGMSEIQYPKVWAIVAMCITIALASRW